VQLNGTGTDPDAGDTLTFLWSQTGGTGVVLNTPSSAQASFTAPNVPPNMPEVLTFQLTVTDAAGLSASDTVGITVSEPAAQVTISGNLSFEFPIPNPNCNGLNFNAVEVRPIRQATVQLIDALSNAVVAATVSDDAGFYSFVADGQSSVFVRVRAELKKSGAPSWDVEVRDNTSATGSPLAQRPMYVLDGVARSPNGADDQRDLLATHGWTGSGFTGTRSAAPFSILDTVLSSMRLIVSVEPAANFVPLDVFWSINNNSTQGTGTFDENVAIGELGSSFYSSGIDSLFLLGADGDDTEEFDDHVIGHEWGHYFEDTFSRSDSIGGSHGLNDRLNARLAFSEGFATALSGMSLNDPVYCDTLWSGATLRGFTIPIENEVTGSFAGWYNESSAMKILYDLWDTNVDGADTSSVGFDALYNVFIGPERVTEAFTSIFSYIEALKAAGTGQNPFIDALMASENITAAGLDRWGSTETNDAGSADALPVYTTIVADGTPLNICSSAQFDSIGPDATGNKLGEHRLLRMNITTRQRYTFDIQADAATIALLPMHDPASATDQSDPDMVYYQAGALQNDCFGASVGCSGVANSENFTTANPVPVGQYVIDFNDFRYEDTDTATTYPSRTCFDFSVTPAP